MTKKQSPIALFIVTLGLLVGCSSNATEASPVNKVPVVPRTADSLVVAEAVLEPARWSELHIDAAGQVTEVLVEIGDQVDAGDPLLRQDKTGSEKADLELSLQIAQQDVVAQKAALDQLLNGASDEVIARADKENAQQIAQAQIALKIEQQQLEKTRLQDQSANVAAAQAQVEQLQQQQAQTRAQDSTPDITIAQVELDRTQATMEDARIEYNEALDRPWEPQEIRDNYAKELRQAEWNFQRAQAELERAQAAQKAHRISLRVLDAQIERAQAQLAQELTAQKAYSLTLDIQTAQVEASQLELEDLRAWENPYLDAPDEQEIAQTRALLQKAELAVTQLELQLQQTELQAPFAGTIVELHIGAGDSVSPGQVAIVLATLDQLEARTVDLTELDVARVAGGQPAIVTVDALPGREFAGTVRRIALQAGEFHGDVTYTVTVALTDPEPDTLLRWGMTAVVKIVTD